MYLQAPPSVSSRSAKPLDAEIADSNVGKGVLLLDPFGVPAFDPLGVLALDPFFILGVPVLEPFSDILIYFIVVLSSMKFLSSEIKRSYINHMKMKIPVLSLFKPYIFLIVPTHIKTCLFD